MQSKLVKKVQIFHGITDGIYGYTYQKKLMNYDLLLCSTRHRYDKFLEENFPKHKLALIGFTKFEYQGTQIFNLSSKKKTILFCPTWGIRSSLPFTSGTLLNNLSKRYNVLFSLHVRHSQYWKDIIEANQNITIVDDDCLIKAIKSSDLIISDVSSAAYEALFFKKKVLLIQTPWNEYLSMSLDKNNIEYQLSKKLALNISWRENIEQKINDLLNINEFPNSHQTKTLEDFFHLPNNTNPSKLAAKKILQLIR